MTTQIEALAAAMTAAGFKAKAWKGQRIYINGLGRDINAFVALDTPDEPASDNLFSGCALKVFSDAAQPGAWRINRSKQVKHDLMQQMQRAGIASGVCEDWRDVIL
jgi:hypothetical protein